MPRTPETLRTSIPDLKREGAYVLLPTGEIDRIRVLDVHPREITIEWEKR